MTNAGLVEKAIATEVDAAMRGEELEDRAFDAKLAAAAGTSHLIGAPGAPEAEDALTKLKAKMAEQKAAKQKQLAAAAAAEAKGPKADK